MKILIVGGGLGGMALAAFLEQRGLAYQLVERATDTGWQGYSLGVWSNTRALFQQLDLTDRLDELGCPIRAYQVIDAKGRQLARYDFEPFYRRFGMAYTAVDRSALHQLLASRVTASNIRMGRRVMGIRCERDAAEVRFDGGETAAYDLVIGADGVHSTVRGAGWGRQSERPTGWRAWYARIDKGHVPPNTMIECVSPGRCVALFDDAGERGLGVFFAAIRPGEAAAGQSPLGRETASSAEALRQRFAGQAPVVQRVLATVRDGDFMPTDLARVRLRRWSRGPLVLLGDAAHAFEPHTGLGASMAMEDAFVLAGCLAAVSTGQLSLPAALEAYERQRRPAVRLAQRINTELRTLAFVRWRAGRVLADQLIRWMPQWPFVRQYERLFGKGATPNRASNR